MPAVRVRVPATSANLGPGFDTLGLALQLYNYVTVRDAADGRGIITISGTGVETLSTDDTNLAAVAVRHLWRNLGQPDQSVDLALENGIPLARGLGSSSAALVGALVAANEWLRLSGHRAASTSELVTLATQLEGHPDNVAAALLGGLVVSTVCEAGQTTASRLTLESEARDITGATLTASEARDAPAFHDPDAAPAISRALAVKLPVTEFPSLVVFIPDTELATKAARAVLPDAVFRADATFNVSHTALLLAALTTGDWDLLPDALQDKLHQPHRARLMPGFDAMLHAAREAGAYGATLSGAGPTVLAWLPRDPTLVPEVRAALEDTAATHEVFGHAREVGVDVEGCQVVG